MQKFDDEEEDMSAAEHEYRHFMVRLRESCIAGFGESRTVDTDTDFGQRESRWGVGERAHARMRCKMRQLCYS